MPLIQYLSRIQFDFGAIALLSDEIQRMQMKRPLLITDRGVADAGILQRALDACGPVAPVVYEGTSENPSEANLLECINLWNQHGCDGTIALGGGSPIDLSKAVCLVTSHGGNLADYNVKIGGSEKIGKVAPQIAIPTAAGTGAEVGRACVMTLLDGTKSVAVNLNMVAETVICDPELTLSLPPRLTAATGIDALSHGIEAYCSTFINPPAAAIALRAAQLAAKWLPIAVHDGTDREARYQMMMAALMGGMCLQKSLGGAHALANPMGELGLHHGTLIGVVLPHVLRFNSRFAEDAFDDLKVALRVESQQDLAQWLDTFIEDVDLPSNLRSLGLDENSLQGIAEKAAVDHLSATNPRPATSEDYLALLKAAF